MPYELLSQSRKRNKREILIRAKGMESFLKKVKGGGEGTFIRDPRVIKK